MSLKGPVTRDTSSIALGLAQIRVIASAANIAKIQPQATASDSVGSLASTKFMANTDYWKHESSFPRLEDYTLPIREAASLECAFEEVSPKNMAFANGIDATSGYTEAHSGEVVLGGKTAPAYVRMEAFYTFPNGTNYMHVIFPRAQIVSSAELDFQAEDAASIPVTFESKNASSDTSGGNAAWDDKPLGRILFT